LLSDYSFI